MVDYGEKLKHLIDTIRKPSGRKYRIRDIAEAVDVTDGYISHIVTGRRKNPSEDVLKRITDFFGVDEAYFYEEIELSNEEFSDELSLRCLGMTNKQKKLLLEAARRIREETTEHDAIQRTARNDSKTQSGEDD